MGDFQADTLRDSIESNWALTGALAKTTSNTMKNAVKFFAHPQVRQVETRKAIEVVKETPLSTDTIHPRRTVVQDTFNVTCRYTVEDVKNSKWDVSEKRIEDMCDEVLRIVKTVYNPSAGTGTFFQTTSAWRKDDNLSKTNQVLIRILTLTLFKVKSEDTTVFHGYTGALVYDTSLSTGDDKPASDYDYSEVFDVQWTGGYAQIDELVDESGNGELVPVWFTGRYGGRFNCKMNMKKADFTDTGSEQIHRIGEPQANGEVGDVVFIYSVTNLESSPATMSVSIPVRIISIEPSSPTEDLTTFTLIGTMRKPPTYVLS